MALSRLAAALDAGLVTLPEAGTVAVVRPPADYDLTALPRERVVVVQGFKPDHDAFAAQGYATAVTLPDGFSAAVLVLPRAKAEAQAAIAALAEAGGPVIVDGPKTHGIESLLKSLRGLAEVTEPLSKAHGKVFALTARPGAFDAWRSGGEAGRWVTAPGLFSADAPDPGSVALADAIPPVLSGRVADLGAGWGYLAARALAANPKIATLDLVEAEHAALDAARRNVTDPRARFHWADARDWGTANVYDHVIANPPFHVGRAADPGLGRAFIAAAARILAPRGTFWMVANRHLPYESALAAAFGNVDALPGTAEFKLFRASVPAKAPARSLRRRR